MYVSIDIETTGLDRAKDQILEVAAVLLPFGQTDPWKVRDFPYFHCIVRHERLAGSVVALSMNSRIVDLLSLAAKRKYPCDAPVLLRPREVGPAVEEWLAAHEIHDPRSLTPLGQNVGAFDMAFLKGLKGWPSHLFHYRTCEVGSMYATRDGCPSLSAVTREFAESIPGNAHEALYDAWVALAAAMYKWQCDERGWE